MTIYHLDHWSGTDGVSMTDANTGANNVYGTGVLEFDTILPPSAPAGSSMFADSETAYRNLQYSFSTISTVVVSGYMRNDAVPGGNSFPLALVLSAAGIACQFGVTTAGEIRLRNRATTQVDITSGFPVNEWFRYIWKVESAAGVQTAWLFPESVGLLETDTNKAIVLSGTYTTGTINKLNIGSTAAVSGTGSHHRFYDLQISDSETIIPYSVGYWGVPAKLC